MKRIKKRWLLLMIAGISSLIFLSNPNLIHGDMNSSPSDLTDDEGVKNGIHLATGFVEGDGLNTVIANCTGCHSAELVIQNRMNRERWNATIRWMQETQNLWELGDQQQVIVDYLVKNYPPQNKGRRSNLEGLEWYELKD